MSSPKHIWITGAGSGLGAAIGQVIPDHCLVTLSGRRRDRLEEVARVIGPERAFVSPCDVTDDESIARAHALATERFGPVDVLVNNAGVADFAEMVQAEMASIEHQIDVNLLGALRCIKYVLPSMVENRRGMIVTINSVAATTTFTGCVGYGASKAGLLAATRSLRQEVRQHNVKVVDLILGATATEIWSTEMLASNGKRMLDATVVAKQVASLFLTIDTENYLIEELTIRPQLGDL